MNSKIVRAKQKKTFSQSVGEEHARRLIELFAEKKRLKEIIMLMPKARFTIGKLAGIRRRHKKEIAHNVMAYETERLVAPREARRPPRSVVEQEVKKLQSRGTPKRLPAPHVEAAAEDKALAALGGVRAKAGLRPSTLESLSPLARQLLELENDQCHKIVDGNRYCGARPARYKNGAGPYCKKHEPKLASAHAR